MTILARPTRPKPMFYAIPRAVVTAGMISALVVSGGGAAAKAQPSTTTPTAPGAVPATTFEPDETASADPCGAATAQTTSTTTTPSTSASECTTVPSAPITTTSTSSTTDAPTSTVPTEATQEAPSVVDPGTSASVKIPYTGLPTENPNSSIVTGKMRSDREELPEGFTKAEADNAEIREYELLQLNLRRAAARGPAPGPDCQQYWPSANWVCGAIRDKYNSLGAQFSFLLFPTSDELVNPDGFGRRQTFANGPI